MGLARSESVADVVSNSAAKDDNVKERVGTQTVSTVDGHAGGFTRSIETGNSLVLAVLVDGDDLTGVLCRDTTHCGWSVKLLGQDSTLTVVVDGGQNGNGLLGDIDTREDGGSLGDTREALLEDLGGQMAELQVDMVLLGADTTTLADLNGHGSRDDVTRGKILGSGGVALHEAFTLRVQEISSLTTGTCSGLEIVQEKTTETNLP